ncbi:Guanylate kinase [Stieleria bergensis]|uniref:Guanylate kinase n=1 Tax=Stieleria bergensis TaxID=2528025 RepID=A0A517T0D1_9BACT|nr:MAG: guanylate kinase [Rhodopirellula sp. TMED11]QDT61848.1 Guanylate kinase [Planctomycetes bacterium SV_7m_r]
MVEPSAARLVIISGPSGAGKSTVTRELLAECSLPLRMSVSATTRAPRPGEQDGKDYHFLDHDRFQTLRQDDAFLECKEVFGLGHWYGTLKSEVTAGLQNGQWVILEIDVQGALDVMRHTDLDPITMFIHPGGMKELEKRLRARGTENEQAIQSRLETAASEMRYVDRYQYEIVNGAVPNTVAQVCQILSDHRELHAC